MDGNTAMRVLRDQERTVRKRVRPALVELSRQADALAEALTPWLGRAWKSSWGGDGKHGRLKGGARMPFYAAYRWTHNVDNCGWQMSMPAGLVYNLPQWMGYDRVKFDRLFNVYYYGTVDPSRYPYLSESDVNYAMKCAYEDLIRLAKFFREELLAEPLLDIPNDVHPPRQGRVVDGVLTRLLVEDIAEQIDAGRELEASLAGKAPTRLTTQTWIGNVARVLEGLTPNVREGFARITAGVAACDSPLFTDPGALGEAYVALGLAYLEEVQERMPDYVEASGQMTPEPKVSMTFSGTTIYGGQFAAQIANIDSTIAGIVQRGGADVADALKALEQAVLAQEDLDHEDRRDLLDNVDYLAKAAQDPPEKRNRGILKSVLSALKIAATSGAELGKAMDAWGDVLNGLVP